MESKVKSLSTGKMWLFAAGQFGWSLLSGLISNWLVYFYQPDEASIAQGQTLFIPQGLVVFGIFTVIGGITAFGRLFDAFTDPCIASLSDRCTSKKRKAYPLFKMGFPATCRFHRPCILVARKPQQCGKRSLFICNGDNVLFVDYGLLHTVQCTASGAGT